MDFIALTNMTGYVKAGNPQNLRFKRTTRPAESNRAAAEDDLYGDHELSSVIMKTPVFADVMREAYERRMYSGK